MSANENIGEEALQALVDERRSTYLRYSSRRIGVAAFLMATTVAVLGAYALVSPLLWITVIALSVPRLIDRYSVNVAGHAYLGSIVVIDSGICWVTGGIRSAAIPVVIVGAAIGVLSLRPRGALFWTLFGATQIGALGFATNVGVELPAVISASSNEALFPYVAFVTVLLIYGLLIRNQRAFNSQIVHASRYAQKLQEARIEVEQAHDALEHSELLDRGSGSLISRMNTGASHGREALGQAVEHMENLLGSYGTVQPRLEELVSQGRRSHLHSDRIRSLSNKIDIMALNTALEAARLGGVSQQFHPLSEEMRRQSGAATRELDALETDLRSMISQVFETKDSLHEASEFMSSLRGELAEVRSTLDGLLDLFEESIRSTRKAQYLSRTQLQLVGALLSRDSDSRAATKHEISARQP